MNNGRIISIFVNAFGGLLVKSTISGLLSRGYVDRRWTHAPRMVSCVLPLRWIAYVVITSAASPDHPCDVRYVSRLRSMSQTSVKSRRVSRTSIRREEGYCRTTTAPPAALTFCSRLRIMVRSAVLPLHFTTALCVRMGAGEKGDASVG